MIESLLQWRQVLNSYVCRLWLSCIRKKWQVYVVTALDAPFADFLSMRSKVFLFVFIYITVAYNSVEKKKRINIIAFRPSLENLYMGSTHFRNYNLNIYGHL